MDAETQNSLLRLLDEAKTTEDVRAVHEQSWQQTRFDVDTLSQVAEFFQVAEQTCRSWRLKSPPMPGQPGRWPIDLIVQWRCRWLAQTDLTAARRQLDYELGEIQLEKQRLELDRAKAAVFQRHDVERWAATTQDVLQDVLQISETLADNLPAAQQDFVRTEVDRHCRDLLTAAERRLQLAEIGKGAVTRQ